MELYLPQIIATAVALFLVIIARYLMSKIIKTSGQLLQKSEIRMVKVRQTLNILINVLFLFILAIIWGVQPDRILVGISSVFAVIGVALFAQWSVLSNITAGMIMFFNAPYRIGDPIRIVDKDLPIEAVIENIHSFYTHIRTANGELIIIPNNLFLQKIVAVQENSEKE